MRPDLQALTPDDLASIANRGLLKKATREIESGDISATWQESEDGTIEAEWSDDVTCTLPGDKTVSDALCDCAAVGMCRHIIRTVLAWQAKQSEYENSTDTEERNEPWDPGLISDELIDSQATKQVITRANTLWKQGILAELLRSAKPSARFHSPGHTIRFPVPNDLRYGLCSCADQTPCVHAILAVRAFRLLEPEKPTGIVYQGSIDAKVDPIPLKSGEKAFVDLIQDGFGGVGPAWRDRVIRASKDCRSSGYIWPGVILEELADEFEKYHDRDAAFSPRNSVRRIGEYLIRSDAIQSGIAPVPQAFIRGTKTDCDISLGSSRFIALGGSAEENRDSSCITVFLQENDSGHPVTVTRVTKEDPDSDQEAKPFHELARLPAVRDASLALLANGQLVTQGGKRKASGKLIIGRARAAVNPQNFNWEKLKAPVLVEDIDELQSRLDLLPPASFRPRSTAGDFHVCPIGKTLQAGFDPITNSVSAAFEDVSGNLFQLDHPWTRRGQFGAESLLASLTSADLKPKFVAGNVSSTGELLTFHPTAVIFETEKGDRRAVLPWLDGPEKDDPGNQKSFDSDLMIRGRFDAAENLATEILLNGMRRLIRRDPRMLSTAVADFEATGYHRMSNLIERIIEDPTAKNSGPVLVLLRLITLARDVASQ